MKSAATLLLSGLLLAMLALPFTAVAGETLREKAADPKKLMVFGDSLVAGYGIAITDSFPAQLEKKLQADGRNIKVINAGVSGDTTSAGVTRLDWSLSQKPDYVIVVLGGNDMLRQIDQKVTRDNLDKIIKALRRRDIPVLLAGMRSYRNLSAISGGDIATVYEDIAKSNDVLLYPFFLEGVALEAPYNLDDGIHPNPAGIAKIVDNIYPSVMKLLEQ